MSRIDLTPFPMRPSQRVAAEMYEHAIAGVEDCFDELSTATFDELTALSPLLAQWWSALDSLDADLTSDRLDPDDAHYLYGELSRFFESRQRVLLAIATSVGVTVPRPDHRHDGHIETSNNPRGFYGFHDPADLEHVMAHALKETA
jgi:hypothetical protein